MLGRTIERWAEGDTGIHLYLSDGKVAIILGEFSLAVVNYPDETVH